MTRNLITAAALVGLMASPALAAQQRDRRNRDNGQQQTAQQNERPREQPQQQQQAQRERAVPRNEARPEQNVQRQENVQRQDQARRADEGRRVEQNRVQEQRRVESNRGYDNRVYDNRAYNNRVYENRGYVPRYDNRGLAIRRYEPRIIRPSIVTVVPYRPYVYRPSFGIGIYYGSDGYYPYGYTPRGYYDPIPGRLYGGLRITDAPRYARVFADGYFVGLVNDFDGIFQHLNLEAGPHHIEIQDDGGYAVAFDVMVRPGETITYRAAY